jgi:integrase
MYGTRLATRSLRSIIKKRFKQADVVGDRKTTHSLRHTAITPQYATARIRWTCRRWPVTAASRLPLATTRR